MKKVNKILMAVIAILLSLVLISTSVVSGIFAKFVITKSATVPIRFKDLGVTVTVTPNPDVTAIIEANTIRNGKSISVTLQGLSIGPGDVTEDCAFSFDFDGTLNVATKMTLAVEYTLSNKLIIQSGKIQSVESNMAYMPISFLIGTLSTDAATSNEFNTYETVEQWTYSASSVSSINDDTLDRLLEKACAEKAKVVFGDVNGITDSEISNTTTTTSPSSRYSYISKTFAAGKTIRFSNDSDYRLGFGYSWPVSYTGAIGSRDIIESYLVEQFANNEFPIEITYTLTLEQIA